MHSIMPVFPSPLIPSPFLSPPPNLPGIVLLESLHLVCFYGDLHPVPITYLVLEMKAKGHRDFVLGRVAPWLGAA